MLMLQLVILAQNYIFNPNQMYMNGYYFKDCNVCIIFNGTKLHI